MENLTGIFAEREDYSRIMSKTTIWNLLWGCDQYMELIMGM